MGRRALRYGLFPSLMALTVLGALSALPLGFSRQAILGVAQVSMFLVVLGLEYVLPYRKKWQESDGQVGHDIGHLLIGTIGGGLLGIYVVQVAYAAYVSLRGPNAMSWWPSSLPLGFQIVLVYLIADLGRWVQHWCLHHSNLLWRFHQLHHSAERMNVWKTSRSHATERIAQQIFMFGLLSLVGAPEAVVFWYVLPNSMLGNFAHSNVDMNLGPLEYVIMGPGAHRLHHSKDMTDSMRNYGSALVLWDILFGTYSNPMKRPLGEVGIDADNTPKGFVDQLLQPFRVQSH
jgi:sterol desaturase/sphingolipid hydroxylase (fatty acid hydroxylase superfamily)